MVASRILEFVDFCFFGPGFDGVGTVELRNLKAFWGTFCRALGPKPFPPRASVKKKLPLATPGR